MRVNIEFPASQVHRYLYFHPIAGFCLFENLFSEIGYRLYYEGQITMLVHSINNSINKKLEIMLL